MAGGGRAQPCVGHDGNDERASPPTSLPHAYVPKGDGGVASIPSIILHD